MCDTDEIFVKKFYVIYITILLFYEILILQNLLIFDMRVIDVKWTIAGIVIRLNTLGTFLWNRRS